MKHTTGMESGLMLELFSADTSLLLQLPFFESQLPAGYPGLADSRLALRLDLNSHLVKHPAATFYARVKGAGMDECGVFHGDILIVDRSIEAREGDLVVCKIGQDFTVKRASLSPKEHEAETAEWLLHLSPSVMSPDLQLCGVVTFIIHKT